jgi:hypothetical protein
VDLYLTVERGGPAISTLPDPRGILTGLLLNLDLGGTICLRFVDPWGDTMFNAAQAAVLGSELRELLRTGDLSEEQRNAVCSMQMLADRCAAEVHTYLTFVGD